MKRVDFLHFVENFLQRSDFSPTIFGAKVLNNPAFVFDLRRGRECREKTQEKVLAWIAQHEKDNQINLTDETGK